MEGLRIIEDSFGSASGPGPRHLLAESEAGPVTLCGVKRFHVMRWWGSQSRDRVCPRCFERTRTMSVAPQADPEDVAAAIEGIAVAVGDLVEARERFSTQLHVLRGYKSDRIDLALRAAHENGFRLAELGDLLGLTRERIRQRIASVRNPAGSSEESAA